MGMFESAEDAATAGVLSLLLEVSGTPKAGNVDREHNFLDLRFEHFLASASAVYPVFLKDAKGEGSIGELVLEAVKRSTAWHRAKNVHFGCFMLLIPLIRCWKTEDVGRAVIEELKRTSVEDSLAILRAFRLSGARVMDVKELSLTADETERELRERNLNLYDWLKYTPEENIVAMELLNGYKISFEGKNVLLGVFAEHEDINLAVIYTYHYLLSKHIDPLIIAKHGFDVAEEVRIKASKILNEFERSFDIGILRRFDEELISKGINPGSIADLTASSIYLALGEGLRF